MQFEVPTPNCEQVKILSHRNVRKQNPYNKLKEMKLHSPYQANYFTVVEK